MKLWFCTYGNDKYKEVRRRIVCQALQFPFDVILPYGPEDLQQSFKIEHESKLKDERGGGYWIWKPQIIKQTLSLMKEGDILLYADSGCHFNIKGKERFLQYLQLMEKTELLSFIMNHQPENMWSKMDTIKKIQDEESKLSGQLVGGIFFIKKTDRMVKLIEKWLELCEDYHLVDDSPSVATNHSLFKEHRHDQSIFSLLRKRYCSDTVIIEDETYPFKDIWPIQARRDKK
jgi:hypothetical protein